MSEPTTVLSAPGPALAEAWIDAVRDFDGGPMDGSGSWRVEEFGPDAQSLAALLEVVRAEGDTSTPLPADHVHCTYYWITDGTEEPRVLGFVALRHDLGGPDSFLRRVGGHIGYSVRPSARRRGHASRALAQTLEHARALGLDRVLITCDDDNLGSAGTIEKNGGVLDGVLEGKRRYWIDLG